MAVNNAAILHAASGSCKTMVDNTLRITFDFEPRDAQLAFKLFGERGTGAAIALLKTEKTLDELRKTQTENQIFQEETTVEKNGISENKIGYGQFAASLYRSGFFYAPKVLRALGTDAQYRQWIQKQPSAASGNFSEFIDDSEGRCVAAHVRRSNNAGIGLKPEYSCVPLTNAEHQLQHQKGESALIGFDFEKEKNAYLIKWGKSVLYQLFEVSSLTEINPKRLVDWCGPNGLTAFLPRMYREYSR